MPTYELTSPEGQKYRVSAPDGATQDQVLSYFKSQLRHKTGIQEPTKPVAPVAEAPETPWYQDVDPERVAALSPEKRALVQIGAAQQSRFGGQGVPDAPDPQEAVTQGAAEGAATGLERVAGTGPGRSMAAGAAGFGLGTMALGRRAAEFTGLAEPGGADALNRLSQAVSQGRQIATEDSMVSETVLQGIESGTKSLLQMATTRGLGAAGGLGNVGQHAAVITYFALDAGNQAITRGKDRGLSGKKLATYATGEAVIEGGITAVFSLSGMGGMESGFKQAAKDVVKQGMRQGIKRLGANTLYEFGEELPIAISSQLWQNLFDVDPKSIDPRTEEGLKNLLKMSVDTAVAVGTTMAMGKASSALSRPRSAKEASNRAVEKAESAKVPAPRSDTGLASDARDAQERQFVGQQRSMFDTPEIEASQRAAEAAVADLDALAGRVERRMAGERRVEIDPVKDEQRRAQNRVEKDLTGETAIPRQPDLISDDGLRSVFSSTDPQAKQDAETYAADLRADLPNDLVVVKPLPRRGGFEVEIVEGGAVAAKTQREIDLMSPTQQRKLVRKAKEAGLPVKNLEDVKNLPVEQFAQVALGTQAPAPAGRTLRPQAAPPPRQPSATPTPAVPSPAPAGPATMAVSPPAPPAAAPAPKPKPKSRLKKRMMAALQELPAVSLAGEWLSEKGTYKRPKEYIKERRGVKAEDVIARERSLNWHRRFGRAVKNAGLVLPDKATALKFHQTLTGKRPMSEWPAEIQDLLMEWRQRQDQASSDYADALEAVGMDARAKAVRDNIGKYSKSVPAWTLTASGRVSQALKSFSASLQHTTPLTKFKRDAWVVTKGKKVLGKFPTEAEAKAFKKTQKGDLKIAPPRTEAEREAEDIHDPGFLLMAGTGEAIHDSQIIRLHQMIADQYSKKVPKGLKAEQVQEWADENGLVQMPHTGRYHNLKATYIPKRMAEDLTELADIPTGMQALWEGYMRVFKKGVVVHNPASHGRNMAGSVTTFATLARISPANPRNFKHYAAGWKALSEKGALWEEMVRQDVDKGDYVTAEINKMKDQLKDPDFRTPGGLLGLAAKYDRAVGKAYSMEDAIFKAAAYVKYKSEGMTPEQAGAEVNRWFPNYDRTSKLTQKLSKMPVGPPFASFLDQSIRIAGRASKDRPVAMAAIAMMPGIMDFIGKWGAGMSDEEDEIMRSGQGFLEAYFTPTLPWRDSKGNALHFDLRYIIPLANDILPQVQEHGSIFLPWLLNGPLAQTVINQSSGRSSFTGKQFNTVGERAEDVYNNMVPLPSVIKHSAPSPFGKPGRIGKTFGEEKNREDTAYAIVGSIAGMNARRPYQGERHVIDAAARAVVDGDQALAEKMVAMWNQKYKPDVRRPVKLRSVETKAKELRGEK